MGHLVSLGHKRIGLLLGPADHVPSNRKLAAARGRRARVGDPARPTQVEHVMLFSLEGGQAAATRLLGAASPAIICASDLHGARRDPGRPPAGLPVPGDVSVVGYDDSALHELHRPAADHGPPADRGDGPGRVELLVGQIAGTPVPPDELLFEPELVVRGSTGALKVAATKPTKAASAA